MGRRRTPREERAYREEQRRKAVERELKAELQLEQQRIRLQQQQLRLEEQQRQAARRQAAQVERERKELHQRRRVAERDVRNGELQRRVTELETLLSSSLATEAGTGFKDFRRTVELPPFDPGADAQPLPMWQWEAFAPAEPSAMGRLFGGAGRYERAVADAQPRYGKALAERAAAERERLGRLEAAEQAYAQRRAAEQEAVDRHNAEVDRLKQRLDAGDPDAVVECFRRVLRRSAYPDGFPRSYRVAYQAEARQLVVEYQLPGREIIPTQARFNYNKSLDLVEAKPRAPKEIAKLYESVVSQIALRTLREVFAVQADGVVDTVVFNGHVSTKDPATGQPRYPCIVSVAATREQFSGLVLTDVTPRETLRHLNALVSPHPFDLEAVRPVLEFDLTKYKFVDEIDMIAGLDGRLDLLELTPTEFEHLVRQLFEEIGMQAWVTQASRDDGVDAVAINPDPIVGGLCIVQAKRYTGVVSTESVRALGGVMDDKRAAKGLMVTTSWYGKESWEFAARHGRIELIDGPRLKHLLKERVGLDVLISLPRRAAKTT
jgi:restriction system protein